jgi:23S rRNA pseudouridine1911/1915/1917 synthase
MRKKNDLEIIYEDDWLIVVDKPSGLLCMSTGKSNEDTAYSRVYDYAGKIFIVHRLDRDTSGLLVFAKDLETKLALQENWEEAVLERRYSAVLEGKIDDDEGWIETWLYENPKSLMVHCYELREGDSPQKPPRKDWQFAATRCRTVKRGEIAGKPYTIVEFDLETGRKNQIRVHSQWIGHPIAGDRKYGAQTNPFGRLALHAQGLSFIHPWTGRTMKFRSKTPQKFKI